MADIYQLGTHTHTKTDSKGREELQGDCPSARALQTYEETGPTESAGKYEPFHHSV